MRELVLLGSSLALLSACGAAPGANVQQKAVLQATPSAYRIINLGLVTQTPQPNAKFIPVSLTSSDQLLGFANLGTSFGFRSFNPNDGSITSLPTNTGADFTIASPSIFNTNTQRSNNLGQVVGRVTGSSNIVVRNPDGSLIDLGVYPPAPARPGSAWGINDAGQIFGNNGTGAGGDNTAFVGDIKTGVFTRMPSFIL